MKKRELDTVQPYEKQTSQLDTSTDIHMLGEEKRHKSTHVQ